MNRRVEKLPTSIILYGVWALVVFEILEADSWITFSLIFVPLLVVWYILGDLLENGGLSRMKPDALDDASGAASTFMALGSIVGLALGRGTSGEQYLYLLVAVGIAAVVFWFLLIWEVRNEEWSFLRAQTSNIFSPYVQATWVSTGVLIASVAYGIVGIFSVFLFLIFIAFGISMAAVKRVV